VADNLKDSKRLKSQNRFDASNITFLNRGYRKSTNIAKTDKALECITSSNEFQILRQNAMKQKYLNYEEQLKGIIKVISEITHNTFTIKNNHANI